MPKTSIQIRCLGDGMIVPDPWLKLRYSWSFISRITFTAYRPAVKTAFVFHRDLSMNLFMVPAVNTTVYGWLVVTQVIIFFLK